MKIVYIVQRFHTNLYWRAKALSDAGHEVFVLANQEKAGERRDSAIKFVILKKFGNQGLLKFLGSIIRGIYFDVPNLSDLKAKLKEIDPDVIVARNPNSLRSIAAFIFANKKTKLFAEAQTEDYSFGVFPFNILLKFLYHTFKVKALITPLKNRLTKTNPFFKYLPFVIPAEDFSKSYFSGGHINIVAVGKYVPRKGHLLLLGAIKKLSAYDIRLTLVGQYNNPETEKMRQLVGQAVKDAGLENVVSFQDNLPNEKMEELYRQHDLFVLPAFDEPASYSVLEAMAAKLAVVSGDDNGTSGYIEEGVSGYIFKNRNIDDLATKIEMAIKDKDKLIEMGERGFQLAKNEHSLPSFVRRFEEISK